MVDRPQTVNVAGYEFPLPEGDSPEDYAPAQPEPVVAEATAVPGSNYEANATPTLAEAEHHGLVYQTGVKGGTEKTGSRMVTEHGRADTPEEAAYRDQSLQAKQAIAAAEGEHLTGQAEQASQILRERAVGEQEDLQKREFEASEAEIASREVLSELDASIQQQKDHWVRGGSPANLFDGGSGTGMLLGSIGIALAGLGGPGMQGNAMQMVNGALDRSIRAQEYQTDSLFKQLQNKYNDRDQARSALKMMQLQYAQTMAAHFAAENATPDIAINLARFQVELNDAYMKEEDNVRAREYGKRTETENFREVQSRQSGWRQESSREKMERVNLQLKQTELLTKNAEYLQMQTGEAPPPEWKSSAPTLRKVADMDASLSEFDEAISLAGGQFTPEGNLIPGSIKEGGATGIGAAHTFLPDALLPDDAVKARSAIEGAIRSMERSKRGRANKASEDEAVKRGLALWENDGAAGLETMRMAHVLNRANQFNALPNTVTDYYRRNKDKGYSEEVKAQMSPAQMGGIREF